MGFRTKEKRGLMRTDVFWITLIILSTSLTISSFVPRMVAYVIVLLVYIAFVIWLVNAERFAIVYHWAVVPMVLLIWTVFALTTVLDPTVAGVLRLGAFTVITGINLFVVPAVIDRAAFHDVLAYVAGAFVLIGLPTAFIGTYEVAGLTFSPWHTNVDFLKPEVIIHTITSVFDNPNKLSNFAAIGTVAAGGRFARSRSLPAAGLVGLNAIGVVFAGGRAALLALVVAGGLYAVYRLFGLTAMTVSVVFGSIGVVVGVAMVFGIVPGPSIVTNADLGGRRALWTAAYEAIVDRPVIGWGPGNDIAVLAKYMGSSVNATHNSYVRMFLISGVLGGEAYLALSTSVVAIGLRNARSEAAFTLLLLIVFLTIQLFEGMTIFGLSLLSTVGALFIGYTQLSGASRQVMFDIP